MKNQKNQMTLTLCLEDNTGKDTNLEVRPDDNFGSFLQKAKKILGYLPKLSDITEGKTVSLDDNIYKFLIEAEMKKDSAENSPARNDESEEFAEIEYLSEDEEESMEKPQVFNAVERAMKTEDEDFTQTEYLEDDSEDPDIVDLEILESSVEEDELDSLPKKKRRLDDEDHEEDIFDYINDNQISPKEADQKIYTTKELLNVLGNSSDSENDENKFSDGQPNKSKIKNKMGSKFADEKQKEIDKRQWSNLKDIKKSTFYARRQLEKRFASTVNTGADAEAGFKMSSFDVATLKRNMRQSSIKNRKGIKEEDDRDGFSSSLDDSRYLPSNYEDVDNEGVYDYMDDIYDKVDMNDLLTERKVVDFNRDSRDSVARAVGGINKMMGIDKKFNTPPTGKRPRGRPRKNPLPPIKTEPKNDFYDSHSSYMETVVKSEPVDVEDEDYVPGKDIDWMRKKKDKYNCRMCFNNFSNLTMAISHALTHRVPHKSVFPCILCAYGFTTYTELQKHMKNDHRKKRVSKKTGVVQATPKQPRVYKSKKEPKTPMAPIKLEIMDDEEVCDVEMLEEWLEEEVYVDESYLTENDIPNETPVPKFSPKMELNDSIDYKNEDLDFFESGDDEEWLMDEADDDTSYDDNIQSTLDETGMKKKRRQKNTKPKCRICLCRFENENELHEHKCPGPKERLRGTRGSHRCALCGQTFPSRRRLIYHRSFHQVELIEWKLVCKHCPTRKFLSEADLFDHINNEHNVDFMCDEPGCSKQFHLRTALRAHARTHGKKTYQCQECGKQFHDIHNLKEHNITHLAVKPFQCHICLKFLNRRSRLRMHLLAHESCPIENCVLSCKHCKMAFKDATDAENHVRESEDCLKNVLSNESSDLIAELENLHEDHNDKNLIKVEINNDISENIGAETAVDEIVNETLAKTGIVSLPVDIMPKQTDEEDPMKALLAEVGVKLMLTEDGTLSGILENHEDECKESASKDNINDLLQASNIKDLLENVGSTLGSEETEATTEQEVIADMDNKNADGNESQGNDKDSGDLPNVKTIRNTQIYTEKELLSQLNDNTKKLITAVKIKVVYRCEYCEKTFCTKDALNVHRKVHDGLRNPFICNICNAAFSTFARCTSHKTTHGFYKLITDDEKEKGSHEVSGYENFPVIKYFLCQNCPKTFLHWTYLQVHKRHKHGESTYYFNCKICGDKFTDSWLLNSHRRKAHAEVVNCKKSANTSYKCADCGQGYNKRIQLAKHRQEVHNDYSLMALKNKPGPFACASCDKMYHTKVGLDGHMRSHNGDIYICDLCGNSFAHRAGLETHHKRVHLREQRFICRTCGQNFFSPVDLEVHRRCHTGEKPFPCDFCPMSFRTKGRRNEHHRTHTGERPFPCDICGMAFRRSNAMKNHRLIHTGERRHTCPHCPKLFHVFANLKSHVKAKHPGQFVIYQVESDGQEVIEDSLKMLAESEHDATTNDMTTNDPSKMLVLEDVIIEENDGDNIIRTDDSANMMEYSYDGDIDAHVQVDEISVNPVEYVDVKDNKVQIQLLETTDHGQGLLYSVEDATDLIQGEVHYTLVDDLGEDTKQQFSIISSDPFVKEEKDTIYYS